ncbi:MAG: hypothetical protein HC898_01795 [Phycisphaerales bacterium]|nr:hypothetical protein [Phycisphaerales bacterium]
MSPASSGWRECRRFCRWWGNGCSRSVGGDWGIGPTIYALLAATGVGMIVSCFRWFIIDHVMEWTGINAPKLDFGKLANQMGAFDYWVEAHYRFYQFYANTLVGVPFVYLLNRIAATSPLLGFGTDLGVFILCAVLFAGSRDALRKYYKRTASLTDLVVEKGSKRDAMTNGAHHPETGGKSTTSHPVIKAQAKPDTMPKPSAPQGKPKPTNPAK